MAKNKRTGEAVDPPGGTGAVYERVEMPLVKEVKWATQADRAMLEQIGHEMIELVRRRKKLEEQILVKAVTARAIMENVNDEGTWSVRSNDGTWHCTYMKPGPRETIIVERLIEAGVPLPTIKKATKVTPITPYVRFVEAKEEE
jgi:hypothetical protein